MGRSPESTPLRVARDSIAQSAVIDRRYRKRCWRGVVVVAMLAVACTVKSADAPPLLSPDQMNAGEIQLALEKLNVLGRVLYIAAHPDDENTNLMAFWSNGSLYDAAYLSVTRGDGGQNILGSELGERLGVIRTQELLGARRIDHARQFFTRALDFGFSKTADETLHIWDHDKILADVVWVIRNFRPDVIATRFSPDDDKTHGHHTASAILATEAFAAAADPKRFPEQLAFVKPWQATRLVWNTSPFFFTNRNLPFDPTGLTVLEAGGYNPLLGKSYTEIAAASISMHKSQGVGGLPRRGARKEYFKPLKGQAMTSSLFEGVDTSWSRVPNSESVVTAIREITSKFNPADPAASVPDLLKLRQGMSAIQDDSWIAEKKAELDKIIAACLGLHVEASTATETFTPGQTPAIKLEAINRSNVPVTLQEVRFPHSGESNKIDASLPSNELVTKDLSSKIPDDAPYSQPYWLRKPASLGTFAVEDQKLIGLPENPPTLPVEIVLQVNGQELRYIVDTKYRSADAVAGEQPRPLVIAPPVFVNVLDNVFVFPTNQPKPVSVRITAATSAVKGDLKLIAPQGWEVSPASIPVELQAANAEMVGTFSVKPPNQYGEGTLRAIVSIDARDYSLGRVRISYPHIGVQTLMPPAEAKLVRADIRKKGDRIGYIPGAGDDVPGSLKQIGYSVKMLSEPEITAKNLAQFSAVVLGIRAYNTQDRISNWLPELFDYVKNGGLVVVQYNTTADLKTNQFGPYPLEISRDRVTDENAPVRVLAPNNPLMNIPNKITPKDFDAWVQERGLYFPNKWDAAYTPILSCNDPKEKPLDGGLLVVKSGKGFFIYTSYSWFRQLPAGVPGAYRLFANMLSLGK
ncbi:MAG TPA: PIG-L family deacetylase [Candidatus Udaeobacter sp.]|jgi:LmbE family N-acetylglucosaminyl deacetylase|nr:PIG-L family deacetylase [Candidatus Udaeobacter sp.]